MVVFEKNQFLFHTSKCRLIVSMTLKCITAYSITKDCMTI